jgi:hypothetical protein
MNYRHYLVVPGQAVNLHHGARTAEGVVGVWSPHPRNKVVTCVRSLVVTRRSQVNPLQVRRIHL